MLELVLEHDRRKGSQYYNYDTTEDGTRVQIIVLEDRKKKERTITAVHAGPAGGPEGEQWNADMETVCTRLLPPTVTLLGFLYAAAEAMGLDVADADSDEDERPDVWEPATLRKIVSALVLEQ